MTRNPSGSTPDPDRRLRRARSMPRVRPLGNAVMSTGLRGNARAASITLDNASRLIPILAALLPVAGGLYRFVSFNVSREAIPGVLAGALPIGDLAVIGTTVLMPSVLVVGVSYLVAVYSMWIVTAISRTRESKKRLGPRAEAVVAIVFLGVVLVVVGTSGEVSVGAESVANFIVLFAAGSVFVWVVMTSPRRLSLVQLTTISLVLVAASSLTSGVKPNTAGTTPTFIRFADVPGLEDGNYRKLGEDASSMWLIPCSDPGWVVRVQTDSATTMTVVPPGIRPPELQVDTVGGLRLGPLGFVKACSWR